MSRRSLLRSPEHEAPYFTSDTVIYAGLENRYGLSVHRGFESPSPLSRHGTLFETKPPDPAAGSPLQYWDYATRLPNSFPTRRDHRLPE